MRTLMKGAFDESRREGTGKTPTLTEPAVAGVQLCAVYWGFNNEEKQVSGINGFFLVHLLFKNIQMLGGVLMLHSCCVIVYACHRFV